MTEPIERYNRYLEDIADHLDSMIESVHEESKPLDSKLSTVEYFAEMLENGHDLDGEKIEELCKSVKALRDLFDEADRIVFDEIQEEANRLHDAINSWNRGDF